MGCCSNACSKSIIPSSELNRSLLVGNTVYCARAYENKKLCNRNYKLKTTNANLEQFLL